MLERTNRTDLKSVGDFHPRVGSNPTSSAIKMKKIILIALILLPKITLSSTDYPLIFPSKNVILGAKSNKDSFFLDSGISFSFWSKKLSIKQITFDRTSYITTPKIINYVYKGISQQTSDTAKISVKDFDVYLDAEYYFSDSILANFGFFLRSRDFNQVSGFGFGDMILNIIFRPISENISDVYLSIGAVVPLAGEPDENLATFRRINQSSFALDIPLYLMMKFSTPIQILTSGAYIFRMSYPFFGQLISPGDIITGNLGIYSNIRDFFPTSDISHNFSFGVFSSYIHGFPERQKTSLYSVWGKSWDVIKAGITLAGTFKKKQDIFGEKVIREWMRLSLDFSFCIFERSFISSEYLDYAIIRFPYLDRMKPGFYSSIGLTIIF